MLRRYELTDEEWNQIVSLILLCSQISSHEVRIYPIRLLLAGGFLSMSSKEQLFFKITH